ncbi:MAG TPA: sugar ABC transporter permease [Candidatus Limnocylindrales bacterium]|nr:sugar ABC transporter permease [Candidatus Limnocylindrales bacterium]
MRRPGERRWWPWAFLAPGLLVYGAFVFLPILDTLRYSFFRWDGLTPPVPVGLDNYLRALGDPIFLKSAANNLLLTFWFSLLPIALGLLVTSLIARSGLPGTRIFRSAVYLPQVLSLVVVAVVWRWLYSPAFGPLNQLLEGLGLGQLARPWLGDFELALPAVGVIGTWYEFGFVTVLMLAGIQKIDESLYEAARLDGASAWQQFRHVTLPGLRNEITVALVFTLIAAFRVFDLIFVLTRGGPGEQTSVLSYLIYRSAFQRNEVGYAAAMAVLLTLIVLAISALIVRRREAAAEAAA